MDPIRTKTLFDYPFVSTVEPFGPEMSEFEQVNSVVGGSGSSPFSAAESLALASPTSPIVQGILAQFGIVVREGVRVVRNPSDQILRADEIAFDEVVVTANSTCLVDTGKYTGRRYVFIVA